MQDHQIKSHDVKQNIPLLTRWRSKVFESIVKEKRLELMLLDEVKKFNKVKYCLEQDLEKSMYE